MQVTTEGGNLTSNVMSGNLQFFTAGGNVNGNSVSARQVAVQSYGGDATLVFTVPPTRQHQRGPPARRHQVQPRDQPGGGNDSYPSSMVSATSHNTITATSSGGDITITEAN